MKCRFCKRELPDNAIFCCWCGKNQLSKSAKAKTPKVPKPTILANGEYSAQLMKNGQRVRVRASSQSEYDAKVAAIRAGIVEVSKQDNRLVSDVVAEYISAREGVVSVSTVDGYLRKAKSNLQPLYSLRVKDLTKEAYQNAIDADREKYSGKTIWEAVSLVQSATGVRYSGLVIPSKKPRKKPPVYSTDDIRKLILAFADVGGQVEAAGLLAMWLSLRRSEIMGLRWSDIHDGYISVNSARVYDKHHKLCEKETKEDASERNIPCDRYVLDKINALPKISDYVFTISTSGIWTGITRVCDAAGVAHGYLHGFRHTNCTIMELLNIPSVYANRRSGHVNDHVRKTTYTDVMNEGAVLAAKKVDEYFTQLTK